MEKVFYFSSKRMRIFRIIVLIWVITAYILLLIFAFNIWALIIVTCLAIPLLAFMLITLNRSKIIIKEDRLILFNIVTKSWNKKEIKGIICNRDISGWLCGCIEIQTDKKIFRSPGYQFLNWCKADKNEQLVKELNQWLEEKKYTRYMHFNSSCSYCAVAYILSSFNIGVEDTDVALKIGLPYIFVFENGDYLAGPMLQSGKYFNLFLNPLGLTFKENRVSKEDLLSYINNKKNLMFGIKTDFGKHAVVLVDHINDIYSFFNPTHEESNQETIINFNEVDLLSRVDEEITIGEIQHCKKKMVVLKRIYHESITNLENYEKDIINFVENNDNVEEYQKQLDILFRPLLLDGLTMMGLINNGALVKTMKEAQSNLLDFIRGKTKLDVLQFKEKICIIIAQYKELINSVAN